MNEKGPKGSQNPWGLPGLSFHALTSYCDGLIMALHDLPGDVHKKEGFL